MQKPDRVFAVQRFKDKKSLVVKIIEDGQEETILKYLFKTDPTGKHVIPFEGAFSTNLGRAMLFPVQHSVKQLIMAGENARRGKLISFADEMIDAVWFLHRHRVAHLDIKPDNLVYTETGHLQLIDFGVAAQVEDEDDMVTDNVGTTGYRAPETFASDGYGGIKPYYPFAADRWSVGVTIDELVCFDAEANIRIREALERFAKQLKNKNPEARPSLAEWRKLRLEATAADFQI